ncbi:hypothetical protein QLQ15_06510 [Lysobacter sp. LF1]|uniref:Uncharacterized protein n=1 Tax=Lysobacter stagni TaxID=3045172 RepID=A0ABT6XFC0_9GAMM|nr:hypothetical protein [Lysobacter sp. LF1]MDI9238565.1 hypothetical protein [Lysobacter sp. LF1]
MTPLAIVASAMLCLLGALLMYLVSPQQQWRAHGPWSERIHSTNAMQARHDEFGARD